MENLWVLQEIWRGERCDNGHFRGNTPYRNIFWMGLFRTQEAMENYLKEEQGVDIETSQSFCNGTRGNIYGTSDNKQKNHRYTWMCAPIIG